MNQQLIKTTFPVRRYWIYKSRLQAYRSYTLNLWQLAELTQLTCGFKSYLKHLPDFLLGQIHIEFVEQLVNLSNAQGAISIFVSLRESLL